MQSHKPKRSLPVPPMSIHQERLPGLYEEDDEDPSRDFSSKADYTRSEIRRREYQSSHLRTDRYLSADNTPIYDSLGSQRNLSSMSYRDPHSPRSMRNEPIRQESHLRSSSRSLERDGSHRSPSRDPQLAHRSPSRILDDPRYRSPSRVDVHRVSLSREPSPAWQRSSLPTRTRPRSPTSPLHSWQRSSLPPSSRSRVSEASLHGSSSSLHPPDSLSSGRYPTTAELLEGKRPPLLTSKSESYSQSFKKRQAESRLLNFRGYGSAKYGKDQVNKDPNAPFEIHFKHRRNSSLDTARSVESAMKRSSTTYQDFMRTASLEEEARAQKRAEEEEDEAYRILKEGLNIAKSRVVYKFDRTSSQDRGQNVSSSSQDAHMASRSRPSRRSDEYGLDDFRYRPATAVHPDMYESRGELDRISHYSSRSNPLENHSSSYLYHSRPYTTHDSYNYSPLSYNHSMNNHHHHIGSNVTQTSTQTDETSLSAPYTSYTTIPNHYRWPDDSRNKPQQRRFFNFNFNFFKNRNMNKKSSDSKFIYMKSPTPPHCTQVLATLAVALGPLCAGLGKGYSSPALASMAALSAQGHHFSISKDQGSWVASLSLLGAFFGSLPAGMSIRYGRKRVLCVVAVPFALSWVLTVVASNVYMLYVASFFGGVCTAIIAVVTPVYISEIAHPDIRGCLCALSKLSSNIGMLLSYLLGAFLNWRQLATVTAIAPTCLFIAALLIPETPSYLLYRGRDTEASASLSWLRSGRDVARELTTMKANIATLRRHEVLEPPSVAFRDLLRPLFVTCGLMVFQKFSGANAFNFYAVPILSETFVGLDPYRAAVVVAFVQICAGMASSALVDTVGRRPLLVFSNMLMSAALAAFGGYVYLKGLDTNENMFARQQWRQSDWVPLFCILVIEIAFALGVSPISWLYIGELFPLKHRGFGALAASVSYACSFASVKSFVDLDQTLGLYGTFWLYSSLAALALVFTLLFVPETKGLSLQEMQESQKGVFI